MSHKPSETWRRSKWLSIHQAASLAADIDPLTQDTELTRGEQNEIEILRSAVWETARIQNDHVGVNIQYEPDSYGRGDYEVESESRVSAEWMKDMLESQGETSGFFFPNTSPQTDAFMDPRHEHFSAELALAVTVWRALENQSSFKSSPKQAIIQWMQNNPKAWLGQKTADQTAVERIATLVNWSKKGGAPGSGA